jgi:AbrB family looped-hinge helix DNA binding protein
MAFCCFLFGLVRVVIYSVITFIFPTVGVFLVGKMSTEEVTVDCKGRIQIPKAVRDKVGLHVGGKARLKVEKENIVIIPPISAEEFIKEMEGCIKEGDAAMDPLKLKKIWEPIEK